MLKKIVKKAPVFFPFQYKTPRSDTYTRNVSGTMVWLFFSVILFLAACEEYAQDDYREYVVLEAYLVANRPLPEVRLSTSLAISQAYDFTDAALEGANIQIVLLDENGTEEDVFAYMPTDNKGIYIPVDHTHHVLPKRTYRIDVDFSNRSEVLRAQTVIPDDFEVLNREELPERIVYQSPEQLEILISPTEKTRSQKVFIFNVISQNPVLENLAPFWREVVEEIDEVQIEEFYNHSSQLINEGFFDPNPDGSIYLVIPWTGIAFFEENLLVINSIDQNLVDLISSREVQLGGSTISPGEIHNLRYNVEGGVGIFGGIAADTVKVYVERP